MKRGGNAQSVEFRWHMQKLCLGFSTRVFSRVNKTKAKQREEMSRCWDDSTCGLFLSCHLATTHLSILNPLSQKYRMYSAEHCNQHKHTAVPRRI